jgi:hypothetical protein
MSQMCVLRHLPYKLQLTSHQPKGSGLIHDTRALLLQSRHILTSKTQRRKMASSGHQPSTPLKQRAVSGSFIIKYPDDGEDGRPKVALFKRSGKVRTYQ